MQTTRRLACLISCAAVLALFASCERPKNRPENEAAATDSTAEAIAPDEDTTKQTEQPAAARPPDGSVEEPAPPTIWGANHSDGTIQVELRGLDAAETKQVAALFEAKEPKRDTPDNDTLTYHASKMPPRFHGVEALDVLTPHGPVRLRVAKLVRANGPSQLHYWLHTEKSDKLAEPSGDPSRNRLDWTLATPAGQMADSATMRLAEPEPVHAKAAPKLRQAFLGGLDADQRKRVAQKLEDEHIVAVDARFPSPHSQMVTINVPSKEHMPLAQAAFVADNTGTVTYTAKDPFIGPLGDLTILAVADPDGDGIDGILYRMDTDGYFIRWLYFDDDGNPAVDTLAGFAA